MKKQSKIIREFGLIWRQTDFLFLEVKNSFDQLYLSDADFENLFNFIEDNRETDIEKAFQIGRKKGKSYIRIKNYVGIIETKKGTTIEILPKIYGFSILEENNIAQHKNIFLKMLSCLKGSPFISIKEAHLKTQTFPILEIFITVFLKELKELLQTGLRKNYVSVQRNQSFLKGKLLFQEQQKRNALRSYKFYTEHDEFLVDSPPNRLIKNCLTFLLSRSVSISNQNQIRHHLLAFDEVPISKNIAYDFQKSNSDSRLYRHYQKTLAWTKIFLMGQSFTNFKGRSLNQALLFPMERIFENYIGHQIKKHLPDYTVKLQDKQFHLINEHLGKPKFRLKPDIVLSKEDQIIIIDTKWKIINQNSSKANYEIAQSDMYQLFGYGEKYKQSNKSPILVLLYPLQEQLTAPLPTFHYSDQLPLYVIPFDLANGNLQKEISNMFKLFLYQ